MGIVLCFLALGEISTPKQRTLRSCERWSLRCAFRRGITAAPPGARFALRSRLALSKDGANAIDPQVAMNGVGEAVVTWRPFAYTAEHGWPHRAERLL